MRWLFFFALILLSACRGPGLQDVSSTLQLSPVLDFGATFPGEPRTLTVRLRNAGPAVPVRWVTPAAPFVVIAEALPTEAASGDVELTVRFEPTAAGRFTGTLAVEADGRGKSQTTLLGEARTLPACPTGPACSPTAFDPVLGACVEQLLPDGTSCEGASVCLSSATCLAGRCVGAEKNCDDSNACTLDTCNAVVGCEHLPAPPCPGDGKCQVGVCDKAAGCVTQSADDGTSCGPVQTCDAADVCISGSCVVRDPPDGYVCAPASPCQGEGLCVANVCARPPAATLAPTWSYDALTADAGVGKRPPPVHDLLLEPEGAVSLAGPFAAIPQLRRNTPQAKEPAHGMASRCLLWNGKLVCSKPNDAVSGIDVGTGVSLWTFNLRTARPDFKVSNLFVARMAVQSSDRLAVLWEAYPGKPDCRAYYLSILDASGKLVSAQQLLDPALVPCNHPHAYGFAADALGDLFIAFAPTVKNPPLISGAPTTTLSFTRDGVFRWRLNDVALKGGELAIARGLLYPENGSSAVLTATGQVAFTIAEKLGRAVVTQQRLVLSPTAGATRLTGYEAGTSTLRWVHTLAAGQAFGSDQLRLASWATRSGPQTIALTFTRQNGRTWLHGVVARDGSAAFTCELAKTGRTEPQLFEIADGSLALMDGADGCGRCEPAYADKSGAFHTYLVPTLSRPLFEPWVGTYGGPGHDHRED